MRYPLALLKVSKEAWRSVMSADSEDRKVPLKSFPKTKSKTAVDEKI